MTSSGSAAGVARRRTPPSTRNPSWVSSAPFASPVVPGRVEDDGCVGCRRDRHDVFHGLGLPAPGGVEPHVAAAPRQSSPGGSADRAQRARRRGRARAAAATPADCSSGFSGTAIGAEAKCPVVAQRRTPARWGGRMPTRSFPTDTFRAQQPGERAPRPAPAPRSRRPSLVQAARAAPDGVRRPRRARRVVAHPVEGFTRAGTSRAPA